MIASAMGLSPEARRSEAGRARPGGIGLLVAVVLAVVASAAFPSSSFGAFEVLSFGGGTFNADGSSATQAGSHPASAVTTFEFPAVSFNLPEEQVKEVEVDLPPGFVGDPTATPLRCTPAQLSETGGIVPACPIESQVGLADVAIPTGLGVNTFLDVFKGIPVYNLVPPDGVPAMFGFIAPASKLAVLIIPRVRTGADYGLTARVTGIPQVSSVRANGSRLTLWGVPSDPSHDRERGYLGNSGCASPLNADLDECLRPLPGPRRAFLTLPSNCSAGPLTTTIRASSWQQPDRVVGASFDTDLNGNPAAVTGCEKVPFDPAFSVALTSTRPDGPTGLAVDLSVPQADLQDPDKLAQANLKRARVVLPEGMTISPSAADGLDACSDAQLALQSEGASACPGASKVGTVSIQTPLLEEPVEGGVFIRSQASDDPASGRMFRIAIVAASEQRGIRVKLAGQVAADPTTGRLVTTFDDNPQLPFSSLRLRLDGGPRAPLATPPDCGPKQVEAQLSAWTGKTVDLQDGVTIDCPGIGGFSPSFTAGSVIPTGGAFSPLLVRVERADGQEFLDGLVVSTPGGLAAKLKGVPLCAGAQADAGTCPAGSRIGSATVGVGPGASPFFLQGQPVYLSEGYKGAPYGLSVVTRAVAGPFDLGTVVVRAAIFVDRADGHLTVVSDPLPTIVKGVPLRLRTVQVDVDRPRFALTPTSCGRKRIQATMHSQQGSTASASAPYRASDCSRLAFTPRLALRLTGKGQTGDGDHPGLKAVLTQPDGQANIAGAAVKLPLSLALDPANASSNALCEFAEGQKQEPHCPRSSIVGKARAVTPILNKPLTGNVYFVKNVRTSKTGHLIRTLPTLLIPLRGEVAINLKATSDVRGGRLVNTFSAVPDAPVTRFELTLKGGRKGILVVTGSKGVCRRSRKAGVTLVAHNAKRTTANAAIAAPCRTTRRR